MNTFQLACFVEVAATLSFSAAAKNLRVSQPAVSHNVKALEDELGCTLVSRSTRSVSLTEEGLQYLSYAHDMLDLAERGRRLVSHSRESNKVTLCIGTHGGIESLAIAPVVRRLHEVQPDVVPDIRGNAPHSALINMLESGTLDVLLEYRSPQGAPAGATVFRRLVDAPATCLVAADHPLAERDRMSVEELGALDNVAICNPHVSLAAIDALQRSVLSHVDIDRVIMCSSPESAIALASAGVACAVMPAAPALGWCGIHAVVVDGLQSTAFGVRVRRGKQRDAVTTFCRLLGEGARAAVGV